MLRKRRELQQQQQQQHEDDGEVEEGLGVGSAGTGQAAKKSSGAAGKQQANKRSKQAQKQPSPASSDDEGAAEANPASQKLELSVFGGMKRAGSKAAWGGGGVASDDEHEEQEEDEDGGKAAAAKAPAWEDEDDKAVSVNVAAVPRLRKLRQTEEDQVISGDQYAERLRNQFASIHGTQAWLKSAKKGTEEDVSGTGLLQSSAKLLGSSARRLPQGRIEVTRVTDANQAARTEAVVQACQFHPTAPALLVGGLDKSLKIFHVDGKENSLLQSIFMRDLPIYAAQWSHNGDEIIIAGRRKFFYAFDIPSASIRKVHEIQGRNEKSFERFWVSPDDKHLVFTGHDGTLILLSNKTKQWVANLKMNGSARSVTFTPDSQRLLSTGGDGTVYVWNMNTRDCIHTFVDDGCVEGTVLAVSPDGSRFACGSNSGVVNLYDDSCLLQEYPTPLKAIMNLTTSIDRLSFNHDSQILGISTKLKKSAFRMLHVPTASVFSNWPTAKTPMNYVNSFSFSQRSEYVAMGNDKGKVLLYKLNHYSV